MAYPVIKKASQNLYTPVNYQTIDKNHSGQRLDNYLISQFKEIPKSHIYRLIRSGQVRVNKGRVKPLHRLKQDDQIRIPPLTNQQRGQTTIKINSKDAQWIESSILHEDQDLIILNKSAGIAVHSGSRCNLGLAEMFKSLRAGDDVPIPAHRLDKLTSGCLIFAKNRPALLQLHQAFRSAKVNKTYLALLVGQWTSQLKEVSAPLTVKHGHKGSQVSVANTDGLEAITRFELLQSFNDYILVKIFPRTGRMHQIRVHAAHCKCPVAQDNKYGNFQSNRELKKLGLNRMFLHAEQVSFCFNQRTLSFTAPLPNDLMDFIKRIG